MAIPDDRCESRGPGDGLECVPSCARSYRDAAVVGVLECDSDRRRYGCVRLAPAPGPGIQGDADRPFVLTIGAGALLAAADGESRVPGLAQRDVRSLWRGGSGPFCRLCCRRPEAKRNLSWRGLAYILGGRCPRSGRIKSGPMESLRLHFGGRAKIWGKYLSNGIHRRTLRHGFSGRSVLTVTRWAARSLGGVCWFNQSGRMLVLRFTQRVAEDAVRRRTRNRDCCGHCRHASTRAGRDTQSVNGVTGEKEPEYCQRLRRWSCDVDGEPVRTAVPELMNFQRSLRPPKQASQ